MNTVPHDFKKRQQYYSRYNQTSHWWRTCYDSVFSALMLLSKRYRGGLRVVELGCNDGSLAVACLNKLYNRCSWHGYDINPYWINHSKQHKRYTATLLSDQIWKLRLQFGVFVSVHTLEHLYPDEVSQLIKWLKHQHCNSIIVCVPLGVGAINEQNHVLHKDETWLRNQFVKEGFTVLWECGTYFGWYVNS